MEADGVLARTRDERQQALDELERGRHDGLGSVGKWTLEPESKTAIWQARQPIGRHWRPGQIAREVLESVAVVGGNPHVGVEAEPLDRRAPPGNGRRLERSPRPETERPCATVGAARHDAHDRSASQSGQHGLGAGGRRTVVIATRVQFPHDLSVDLASARAAAYSVRAGHGRRPCRPPGRRGGLGTGTPQSL